MELEEFKLKCPILMECETRFENHDEALLAQGKFFKTHRYILEILNPREKIVLRLRCGMVTGNVEKQSAIAEQFNVSPQRISAIENSGFRKLKDKRCIQLLMNYTDETFDNSLYKTLYESQKALLRKRVVNSLNAAGLQQVKMLPISRLPLDSKYAHAIISRLQKGGITNCAELVLYMQQNKDFKIFGPSKMSVGVITTAIFSLIEGGYIQITDRDAYADYLKYKELEGEAIPKAQIDNLSVDDDKANIMNKTIEKSDFSTRTFHCLKRIKEPRINTVGDLVKFYNQHYPLAQSIKGFGAKCEQEVMEKLVEWGMLSQAQEKTQEVDIVRV